MKKLLSTAAVLAATVAAQPAFAQSWTGPYVGAFVGVNGQRDDVQDYWCDAACDAPTLNHVSVAGGLTAGYNQQIDDNFVVGLEADLGTGAKTTDVTDYVQTWNNDNVERYTFRDKLKWNGSIRARAGLAMNNTMMYVTGGYALAKANLSEDTTFSDVNYDDSWGARWHGTLKGYVLGGGVEHVFNGRFSVKLEATHTVYGSKRACFMDTSGTDAGVCWDDGMAVDDYVAWHPTLTSARLGFNYMF